MKVRIYEVPCRSTPVYNGIINEVGELENHLDPNEVYDIFYGDYCGNDIHTFKGKELMNILCSNKLKKVKEVVITFQKRRR